MIADLQPGEVVVAEKIDRISRLPLPEAERLVASIRAKGARLAVPGVVDFTDFAKATDAVTRIVLESVQELLLKLALQMARDDYETRRERHPVAPADEVRGQRQRQGRGDDHPDVAGAWRHILLNGHYTFQSGGKMIDLDALLAGLDLG